MTTNSPKVMTLYDLPNELVEWIFEYLTFKDLIQCSMVCRRFKLICKVIKIHELIISNRIENIKRYWFYTNKQFNHLHAIDVATLNLHRSTFRTDQLRRLYFEGSHSEYAQLQVNDLTLLEQVKIKVKDKFGVKHEIHINLPHVKMIEIDTANHEFFITTPKLEALSCKNFNVIHLNNPKTIKCLQTTVYSDSLHVLKNLQFLLLTFIGDYNRSNVLSVFPELKILSCSNHRGYVPLKINNMVEYKRNHLLSKPKIYFLSVEIDGIGKINEFNSFRDDFYFQLNNYNLLAETVFQNYTVTYKTISYGHLMKSMNGKIPNDFFKKYFRTNSIWVEEKVEDHEHLFNFLKNFEYLTELSFTSDSLDQSYLNRLDELDQLKFLSVRAASSSLNPNKGEKSDLNFDFLLKLQQLQHFDATIDSSKFFDLAPKLLTQLKYFKSITFFYEENYVWIRRNEASNAYDISCYRYKKSQLDFNGLCREVDAIRKCPPIQY